MNLHIGENRTVLQTEIVAIVPAIAGDTEQSLIFLADGTAVLSSVSAHTLQKRMSDPYVFRDHLRTMQE